MDTVELPNSHKYPPEPVAECKYCCDHGYIIFRGVKLPCPECKPDDCLEKIEKD